MLAPLKQVGKEYKTLMAKMAIDNNYVEITKADLVNLCDIGKILCLPCMLESINALMKCVGQGCFLFVATLQLLRFAKLMYIRCIVTPPLHFNLRIFLNSQMLQTHLVELHKIG